jgi:hypothetical protein
MDKMACLAWYSIMFIGGDSRRFALVSEFSFSIEHLDKFTLYTMFYFCYHKTGIVKGGESTWFQYQNSGSIYTMPNYALKERMIEVTWTAQTPSFIAANIMAI